MTTILEVMKGRALAEFDQIAAAQEATLRVQLAKRGCSQAKIEQHIAECRPELDRQRAEVGRIVTVELMKCAIPLEAPSNDS